MIPSSLFLQSLTLLAGLASLGTVAADVGSPSAAGASAPSAVAGSNAASGPIRLAPAPTTAGLAAAAGATPQASALPSTSAPPPAADLARRIRQTMERQAALAKVKPGASGRKSGGPAEVDRAAASTPTAAELHHARTQRLSSRLRPPAQPLPNHLAALAVPHAVASQHAHWSYHGETGPERWGSLNPAWAKCGNGQRQSPIDVRDGLKLELEKPSFSYRPSRFSVLDTGHTIRVDLQGENSLSLGGRSYELVQFHFHRPAEERINGRDFEMVVHLEHKDAQGRLAVVAVLIESGERHEAVQAVWNNLPLERNEPSAAQSLLDPSALLPERREYYTYVGSLTTPPCSEGVLWVVLKQPIRLSPAQLQVFARLYPMNARPLQPLGGRRIKESE